MKRFLCCASIGLMALFFIQNAWADIPVGSVPPTISLQGDLGGRLDDSEWSSSEFKDKITVMFYVDPDEADLNNDASEALKKEDFPLEKYQSYAIINMDATWLPNFAISSKLEDKQKTYKTTIYVRDYEKVLVKKWGLTDDTSDVLVFDKVGKLIFRKDGKLNDAEIKELVQTISSHIED